MDVQSNWWTTFFSGLPVEFWLNAVSPDHTEAEAQYVIDKLGVAPGASVLDVACGGGRIANALARRGFSVVGVDISPQFLDHARAADAERRVEWRLGDMRDLPWPERFDGAVCLGNSFGYLDDEGNAAFAASVARALKPGGRLVVDTGAIAETLLPRFVERSWTVVKDIRFLVSRQYDHVASRARMEYTFIRDGVVDTRPASQRVYTYGEFARLWERAGLQVIAAESVAGGGENPYAEGRLSTKPFAFGASGLIATLLRG